MITKDDFIVIVRPGLIEMLKDMVPDLVDKMLKDEVWVENMYTMWIKHKWNKEAFDITLYVQEKEVK